VSDYHEEPEGWAAVVGFIQALILYSAACVGASAAIGAGVWLNQHVGLPFLVSLGLVGGYAGIVWWAYKGLKAKG
jgi:hypothetical protein